MTLDDANRGGRLVRIYSVFDLAGIVAEEDARRALELKDTEATTRKAAIAQKRTADAPLPAPGAPTTSAAIHASSNIDFGPVPPPLRDLDFSWFHLQDEGRCFLLSSLPVGLPDSQCFPLIRLLKNRVDYAPGLTQAEWLERSSLHPTFTESTTLLSGPEFEAVVNAAAAYRPTDADEQRVLSNLRGYVRVDLFSRILTRSFIRYGMISTDYCSHDGGRITTITSDLSGPSMKIAPDTECDALLRMLLGTTRARYCAARDALSVPYGSLRRRKLKMWNATVPLIVGIDVEYVGRVRAAIRPASVTFDRNKSSARGGRSP